MKRIQRLRRALAALGLSLAVIIPVQSRPPSEASGLLQYTPYFVSASTAGCNTTVVTFEEGEWFGSIMGASEDDGRVTVHCSGLWTFHALSIFENATVIDESGQARSGPLVLSLNGSRPDASSDWFGYWVVLAGEGEIANLRGQGTWSGPGAPGFELEGDIDYEGQVHFRPN